MSGNIDIANYEFEEPVDGNFAPLPDGDYPFRISEVYQWEESQRGIPYLPLELEILNEDGQGIKKVRESLFFSKAAKFKIDQFVKCIKGTMKPGQKIDFSDPSFLKWKEGKVKLGQKPGDTNPDQKFNEVKAWLYESSKLEGKTLTAPAARPSNGFDDDDIPF